MPSEDKKFIFLAFFFACVPLIVCPVIFPQARLTFFAPFLALMLYKRPLLHCLWYALGCGFIMDLLATEGRLGVYAMTYAVTTWVLFQQKRHFFEDRITTLPMMTLLFSILSTLFLMTTLKGMGYPLKLSLHWIVSDLVVMPLADAVYGLVWFALPAYLLRRRPGHGRDNTLSFRNNVHVRNN